MGAAVEKGCTGVALYIWVTVVRVEGLKVAVARANGASARLHRVPKHGGTEADIATPGRGGDILALASVNYVKFRSSCGPKITRNGDFPG